MDAVAAGLRAEIDDFIADAARLGVENLIGLGDAHRHGIDENIAVIARVEIRRSADGRHPKTIAIGADPGDDPRDKMARARMVRRAETQQVQAGDRPRAHGEHIAQDAANARRGALKRLDVGGVVVALHLEDAGKPVADVDDTGVFPRPLNDPGRLGGKSAQMFPRGFVGAMLVPHRRENAELGKVGVRPMRARMRAYSSGFSPCAAAVGSSVQGDLWVSVAYALSRGSPRRCRESSPKPEEATSSRVL